MGEPAGTPTSIGGDTGQVGAKGEGARSADPHGHAWAVASGTS